MSTIIRTLFLGIISVVCFAATASVASAQPTGSPTTGGNLQIIDGVAAIVGNEVILISDVLQQTMILARGQQGLDPRDPKLQQEVLNAIIDEKLVLTRAQEDSIEVSEEEVTRAVDRQIERIIAEVGSVERVEEIYKTTIDRIRRESREIIRQQLLFQRVRQMRFSDIKLTERDLQEFYQQYRDSLPNMPEQVELQHIVLKVKPSAAAKDQTIALARAITDSIRAGGDFADFARRYSADRGSAEAGGDLGFVEPGKFIREFEDAVKKLGVNEISPPVESVYGIHIIQLLDRRGDATRSRHILFKIQQSGAERDSIIAKLNDIRAQAASGVGFDSLAMKYSQDEESRGLGGSLGKVPVEQLPPGLKEAVAGMRDGEISAPQPYAVSPTESGYHIVRLVRRIAAHQLDPTQDRASLERLASAYKQNAEFAKWVRELRKDIYWEIKTDL
jgi:peptidyl-prolyl cis-trans isomerase SurA